MRRFRGLDTDSRRWFDFPFRDTDIVISSPMKAGTTWTQMICALLVFRTPDLPAPLGELSPWLDMQTRPLDDVVADLEAQSHRRFIKTHTPVDCLPIPPSVTVVGVGRHPLDLYASAARHSANIDARRTIELVAAVIGDDATNELLADRPRRTADPGERLRFFLEEDHPAEVALTLAGVMDHYRSFLAENVHIVRVHYADLMDDREREMRRLAADLGIDVADDEWPDLVAAADFATMKARRRNSCRTRVPVWSPTPMRSSLGRRWGSGVRASRRSAATASASGSPNSTPTVRSHDGPNMGCTRRNELGHRGETGRPHRRHDGDRAGDGGGTRGARRTRAVHGARRGPG